jgi:hypothetical protein
MEQSRRLNHAAVKDALIKSDEEDCAGDMEHIAILMNNPLHLIYHIDQHLMKRLQLFPTRAPPPLRVFKMQVAFLLA